MIKVLLVDDHALVREGLKRIIEAQSDIEVAGEAKTAAECLQKVRAGNFDVVLMDISLPGKDGLEALKSLKTKRRELPVLMLSMHPEEEFAVRALKAGASGYLTKDAVTEELLRAIRKVIKGQKYESAKTAKLLAQSDEMKRPNQPHERLSYREFAVMCLFARGKTIREISSELSLSVSVVSTCRRQILDTMRLKNTAELARYAVEHHLITPLS